VVPEGGPEADENQLPGINTGAKAKDPTGDDSGRVFRIPGFGLFSSFFKSHVPGQLIIIRIVLLRDFLSLCCGFGIGDKHISSRLPVGRC